MIGVAYFEKLAIDNEWLGETARVIQGGVVGLALTYAGLRFVRAGYDVYGQMITGGGAAILLSLDLRRVQLLPPDRSAGRLRA